MFFSKKPHIPVFPGKIEVFSRHCPLSSASSHKKRIPGFSKVGCYQNLMETIDLNRANITHFLDVAGGNADYLPKQTIQINEGTEAGSFLRMLEYVISLPLNPETIVYFVEDDYIHKPLWVNILQEAFEIPNIDYVTLYDHNDKYFFPIYAKLTSQLFVTPSCHWRTTPSTTQTFAMRFKTLIRDLSIHRKYSTNRKISADHEKFLHLGKKGAVLISSIPGWSTHAEPEFASPTIDWAKFFTQQVGIV